MSGSAPDISGCPADPFFCRFAEGCRKIRPVVPPHGLREDVRSRDPPVVRAVFDIPDGRSHTATCGGVDDDGLLLHKSQVRAVNHPAVPEVIQQRFHLPRNMVHIGRRTEDDQLGLLHRAQDRCKSRCSATALFLPVDAGIASHADMGHIPRELKLEKLTVR